VTLPHITGLINQIPLIGGFLGGPLQLFASFIDNNVDTFRELSTVGVDFGNSIFAAQEAATRSRLSLDTFASAVGQNSTSLALLGGNASRGAEIFRDLSNRVQRNFIPRFSQLGLTMEETAEFQGDFLDIQTRLGRAQQRDQRILGRQTSDYIEQIDLLAKVTGAQREQISEQLKEQALDKRIQGLLATLPREARKTLQSTAAALEAQSPAVADAFKNMVATGGVPVTDFGRDLARLNPRLQQLTAGVRNGTVSQQEVFEEFRRTARIANQQGDQFIQFTGTLAALGSEVGSATLAMLGFENFAEGFNESQQKQIDDMERGGKALAAFEGAVVQARNQVLGALIRSDVFTDLQTLFNDFIGFMADRDGGIAFLKRGIERFSTYFSNLYKKLVNDDLDYTLGDMIAELGADALEKIAPLFVKLGEAAIKGLGIAIKELFSNPLVVTATVTAIAGIFAGPAILKGVSLGIAALFGSVAAKRLLLRNINKLTGNRGPGPSATTSGAARTPKLPGALALGAGAYNTLNTVGDESLSTKEKIRDIVGEIFGIGFGIGGSVVGAGAGPVGSLALGTGGYITGKDVGTGLAHNLLGLGNETDAESNTDIENARRSQAASTVTDAQLERLDKLVGFAPQIDNLKQSVGGFQNTFNSLDLNYREIDRTTRSLEKMTDQLEEINTQLAGGEQGFFDRFGNNDQVTAGDVISGANTNNTEQLQNLNRVMKDILGVLLSANDMERKHLNATRRLTTNIY